MADMNDKLLSLIGTDNFLEQLYLLYQENLDDIDSFIQQVVLLHNNNQLDIISEASRLNKSRYEKINWYSFCKLLNSILHLINVSTQDILNCCIHIGTETGNYLAIEKYLEVDINRCDELINLSINNIDEKLDFISIAIIVGSSLQLEKYVNKAIELCNYPNDIVGKRALSSLGKIDYKSNNKLIDEAFNIIEDKANCCIEDFYPSILWTMCLLYKQKQDLEKQIIKVCTTILKNESDELVYSASQVLFYEGASLSKPIYNILLNTLSKVDQNNKTILDLIDHILCNLLNKQEKSQLYIFLENLLIKNNIQITIFNSFINELLTRKHDVLNTLITSAKSPLSCSLILI